MSCGHASTASHVGANRALEHYDNTCSIVASVCIGENKHGVWVAGALVPGITPDQVTRMMSCRLSGDWRAHRERVGMRELVAALLVPVPGFPMARTRPSVELQDGQLVASSMPVRFVRGDEDALVASAANEAQDLARAARDVLARSIGRDSETLRRELAAQVHRG
jgi:hypothetical protein